MRKGWIKNFSLSSFEADTLQFDSRVIAGMSRKHSQCDSAQIKVPWRCFRCHLVITYSFARSNTPWKKRWSWHKPLTLYYAIPQTPQTFFDLASLRKRNSAEFFRLVNIYCCSKSSRWFMLVIDDEPLTHAPLRSLNFHRSFKRREINQLCLRLGEFMIRYWIDLHSALDG